MLVDCLCVAELLLMVLFFPYFVELKEKLPLYPWKAEMDQVDSVKVKEVSDIDFT